MNKLLATILLVFSIPSFAQDFSSICLDETEREMILLINEFRKENNLPSLDLSASLSYVADVHVKDLYINKPYKNCGSLNSWSDKGRWSPLCYNNSKNAIKEMKSKPAELTSYKGQSMEVVYFKSSEYNAYDVLSAWKKNTQIKALILNAPPYHLTKWKCIGVACFNGYLSVWFGPVEDKNSNVNPCESNDHVEKNDIIGIANENNSHKIIKGENIDVIVAVASDEKSANQNLEKLRKQGYNNSKLLIDNKTRYKYRISAGSFDDQAKAEKLKEELITKGYKDAWILKR